MVAGAVFMKSVPKHPEANTEDQQGREETQPGVELLIGQRPGHHLGNDAEDYDAEGMGEGNNEPHEVQR